MSHSINADSTDKDSPSRKVGVSAKANDIYSKKISSSQNYEENGVPSQREDCSLRKNEKQHGGVQQDSPLEDFIPRFRNSEMENCHPNLFRTEGDKFKTTQCRVLNYGSMDRGRRGESKKTERRISYGSAAQNLSEHTNDGRPDKLNTMNKFVILPGSLEAQISTKVKECSSMKKENVDGRNEMSQSKFGEKIDLDSLNKQLTLGNKLTEVCHYSPNRTNSTNLTSYYSHVSRLERSVNQSDTQLTSSNPRRSSYDFTGMSPERSDRTLGCGRNLEPSEKSPLAERNIRRLSQPPMGVPPPFYHPPPPHGKSNEHAVRSCLCKPGCSI